MTTKLIKECKNEGDVKKAVKELFNKHAWFWWMPPASVYGKKTVDFCAIWSGVFMAIETKHTKTSGPVTALQLGFLTSIQTEGGYAFVVNENRLEWLGSWLEAFARSAARARQDEPMLDEDGIMLIDAIRELTREIV
jgi:hypothetical protein